MLETSEDDKRHFAVLTGLNRVQRTVATLTWIALGALAVGLILWAFGAPLRSSINSIGRPSIETVRMHTIELSGKDKPKPEFQTVIDISYVDRVDSITYFIGYAVREDAAPLKILMYDTPTSYGYRAWPY